MTVLCSTCNTHIRQETTTIHCIMTVEVKYLKIQETLYYRQETTTIHCIMTVKVKYLKIQETLYYRQETTTIHCIMTVKVKYLKIQEKLHITTADLVTETNRFSHYTVKASKCAKIRNRYYQVPHLTQDTNGNVTISQLDTTNQSQKVSPFPAGDHKAHINRRTQRHSKHMTEKT